MRKCFKKWIKITFALPNVLTIDGKIFLSLQIYKKSLSNKKGIHKNLLNAAKSLVLYDNPPRMIPKHLNPTCYKMNITVEQFQEKV